MIVGDVEQRTLSALNQLVVAEGLEPGNDVRFMGWVADEDLPAFYSLCELFAYPSIYEGFGLPPLEAMACGAPVVILDNSSLRELYSDCSLVVAPVALAPAIRRLLEDGSLREKLAERGLARAQARSWDDVAAETLAVYERALAAG